MTFIHVEGSSIDPVRRRRLVARLHLMLGVAGPAAMAALLPSPGDLVSGVSEGTDPVAVLGSAMLLAVAAVVWGLLVWAAVVALATVAARIPGTGGRAGATLLRVLAPAAARRILIVATGMSLVAGASACSTAYAAPAASGPSAAVAAGPTASGPGTTTPVTSNPATPPGSRTTGPAYGDGGYAGPGGQIDLDWPLPGDAAAGSAGTAAPGAHAPGVSTPTSPATTGPARSEPARSGPLSPTAGTAMTGRPTAAPSAPTAAPTQAPASGSASGPAAAPVSPPSRPPAHQAAPETASTTGALAPSVTDPAMAEPAVTDPAVTDPTGAASPPPPHSSPAAPPATDRHPRGGATVTVRPGDSLWTIAARHLPAHATDAQIDAAWHAWYRANRGAIGADPDLILPGQHLAAPHPEGTSR